MTKSIRRPIVGFMAASALASFGGSASAEVRYDFTAFSSTLSSVGAEFGRGEFSVVLPDFVTTNTSIPPDLLSSCTFVVSPASESWGCGDHKLLTEYEGWAKDFIAPARARTSMVAFDVDFLSGNGYTVFYHFADGAFSKPGVHETVLFGTGQAGRLVVSVVPEPSQWMMLLLGLAGVGVARWRRAWQA
jgi:hypothetical protein